MTDRELGVLRRLLALARSLRAPYRDSTHLALKSMAGAGVCSGRGLAGGHTPACLEWQVLVRDGEALLAEHEPRQGARLEAAG